MVMTPEGPLSMCVHNAKRDDYLLVAASVKRENKILFFNPVSGALEDTMPDKIQVELSRKTARGRAKIPKANNTANPNCQTPEKEQTVLTD